MCDSSISGIGCSNVTLNATSLGNINPDPYDEVTKNIIDNWDTTQEMIASDSSNDTISEFAPSNCDAQHDATTD